MNLRKEQNTISIDANLLKTSFEANEIISSFATVYNIVVNILHFRESINIYNITQDITLTKTTPITDNFLA